MRTAALVAAGALLVSCSAGGDGGSGAAGDAENGVPVGASKEEYAAALADMDPVELTIQLPTAPNGPVVAPGMHWAEAVEEWSDGKISIELLFAGSRVPVHEMGPGLRDGLVDGGYLQQDITPELFPVATYAARLVSLHEGSPFVGTLQMFAAWAEFGNLRAELVDEARSNGIEPLIWFLPGAGPGLYCRDAPVTSRAEASGKTIRTNAQIPNDILQELGAATVNIAVVEVYQALERGTVDCLASTPSVVSAFGIAEVTDHWTIDDTVQPPAPLSAFGFNKSTWDGLPLVARQLLWDRLDVFLDTSLNLRELAVLIDMLEKGRAEGVEILNWDADARQVHEQVIEAAREDARQNAPAGVDGDEFVLATEANHEKWAEIIAELGLTQETSWPTFLDWWEDTGSQIDLDPLIDRIVEEVLVPARPGS